MSPRKKIGYSTKLDPALRESMRQHKDDSGVPEAQMIDRALRAWLSERGVMNIDRADGRVGSGEPDGPAPPRELPKVPRRKK